MKQLINKIKTTFSSTFSTKPSNALLLFLTGFFFTQFMLMNILYAQNPFGGWVTSIGTFTNTSILFTLLLALSICLIALWLSVIKQEKPIDTQLNKASIMKSQTTYSPIDFPKGSTLAVVPGYTLA